MYLQQINQINGIIFTAREIDVISCILNVRGSKKIGDILSISPRTVEGHIKNILTKIASNSQESIKDFVERSPQLILVKRHYIDLLINRLFLSQIAKVAVRLKDRDISCSVNCVINEKLEYIISYLKLANINVSHKTHQNRISNQKTIEILTEEHLLKLKQGVKFDNIILICFDKEVSDDFLQKFSRVHIIDCFNNDQMYSAIFKIIELLAPNIDLSDSISNFNRQKNNVINLKIDLTTKSLDTDQEKIQQKLTIKKVMITSLILIALVGTVLLAYILINKGYKGYHSSVISNNFLLPNKKLLLERKIITDHLDKIFTKPHEINIAVLIGVGGAGKTTIARYYASNKKSSIVWEINAETKKSISLSLEGLAYNLCSNNADKQALRSILDIKDFTNKDKQLLLFTQKQLKSFPNWLIIYDNVESFKDVFEYFPYNAESWGRGKVIITTRDATIKNSDYINNINVINVGEINKKEKLELFKSITNDSPQLQTYNQALTEQFLENIPSFPLDISTAAHYLKDTGIDYNKYLEEIKVPKKEFTELQILVLQDVNQYTKTRYNIISLTLQNIIKANPEFYDLILLIALLDSQDIPEDLLSLYKNQYVVSSFLRNLKKNSLITNIQYQNNNKKEINNLTTFSIHRSTQNNILADIINSLSFIQRQERVSSILTDVQSYILKQIDLENSTGLKNLIRHCDALLSKQSLLDKDDLTSINNDLGIIYYYLGQDKQAKDILERNLDVNKQDQETALILTHLGAIYRKIGQNYQMAIDYLEKAIVIYDNISPESVRKGLALMHLGNTYRTLGNFQNATEALQKSANIYHDQPGYYAGEARALGYLGVAYREQCDLVKAKNLLEQAISLYNKEQYPRYSSVYAGTLAHLAITYRMMEQYYKAKDILEESVDIYKQIRPEDHPDIGRNILNLGIIYGEIQENTKAKELLEKSLRDYERNYGKGHIETGKVLNHLGRFYILSKNFKSSEETLIRASNILEQNAHPEVYRSFELLGDLYSISNKELALTHYNKSLKLALKYFSADSMNVNRIRSKIER